MPLWKTPSKRSFKHNVKVEYKALRKRGLSKAKASKRAVAIAYDVQRSSKKRKR